jgi:membrane-bound lytic murein transglycosylase D
VIPTVRRVFQRLAPTLIALLLISGCSSTRPDDQALLTPIQTEEPADDLDWEDEIRLLVDELMAEARQLAAEGMTDEALAMVDDALCEVLAAPPGYELGAAYLEYVGRLVIEAEALEEDLELHPIDGETGELVDLPPIDVTDVTEEPIEIGELPIVPDSDYPLVLNSTVQRFLEALTKPGEYRTRVETGLRRSGQYLPMIRVKMGAVGLPEDLAYLPLIESAFSLRAYSRARAHGMWQFISSTGRHYGLEIGPLIDERRDPIRSTEAAIAYLYDLYEQFDDWHLALAAYNSGAGNVRRAIRRARNRDFWTIRRYLPRETRNYVPAFIASVIVAKQPDRYAFPVPVEKDWRFDMVTVPDAIDLQFLASRIDLDLDTLRELNPAIRRDLTPARRATSIRLPTGHGGAVQEVLETVPRSEWAPRLIHTVRQGDSLYSIAQRYGSSVSAIRQANGIRGSLIRPGQSLLVPRLGIAYAAPKQRVADAGSYVVQRNDTLWDIARSFSITLDSLCAANGLSRSETIHPGQKLTIPAGAVSASTADAGTVTTYRVRRGDTLYDIARRFGTSVSALKRANGLRGSRIYPGDVLRIPSSRAAG